MCITAGIETEGLTIEQQKEAYFAAMEEDEKKLKRMCEERGIKTEGLSTRQQMKALNAALDQEEAGMFSVQNSKSKT